MRPRLRRRSGGQARWSIGHGAAGLGGHVANAVVSKRLGPVSRSGGLSQAVQVIVSECLRHRIDGIGDLSHIARVIPATNLGGSVPKALRDLWTGPPRLLAEKV